MAESGVPEGDEPQHSAASLVDAQSLRMRVQLLEQIVDALSQQADNDVVTELLTQIRDHLDERVTACARALHESETQYRSLIDQAMDSIFVFDADSGRFLDVNAAACNSLGYNRDELLMMSVTDIVDSRAAGFLAQIRSRLEREGTVVLEGGHRRRDGTLFPVETHLGLILLQGEIRVLAISHDVTAQRQAEEQMLQAQKMEGIGTLVGGIAHDFKYFGYISASFCR